jgi:hypothetical protein
VTGLVTADERQQGTRFPLSNADAPKSWATARRKRQRDARRAERIPDPGRPKKMIHPSADCPHGTAGGYYNWGCQCLWTPESVAAHSMGLGDLQPGCEPAQMREIRERRSLQKMTAVTKPLPVTTRKVTPPPGDGSPGRHRKTPPHIEP